MKKMGSILNKSNLFICVAGITLGTLLIFIGYEFLYRVDDFSRDVLNSYIINLCGTQRFSSVPGIDICFVVFFYVHVLLYLCLKRRLSLDNKVFDFVTVFSIIYIVVMAILYMKIWAVQNIQLYNEYLTGFEEFMLIPTASIYLYWGYVILYIFVRKKGK